VAARAYQKRLIGSNDANVDDPRMGRAFPREETGTSKFTVSWTGGLAAGEVATPIRKMMRSDYCMKACRSGYKDAQVRRSRNGMS
jgi:hypothetical protein